MCVKRCARGLRGCLRQVRGPRAQLAPSARCGGGRRSAGCRHVQRPPDEPPVSMPSATMSSDTGTVPTRVTSSRFIGRSRELAELEAALADAAAGRPSLAFVAGESGVGKTRLLQRARARSARGRGPRRQRRLRRARRGRAPLRPDRRRPAPPRARRRPRARRARPGHAGRAREPAPRARAGDGAPGHGPRRAGAGARVRGAAHAARPARAPRARGAGDRGPALGRRLDARLPRLPRAQPALRARAASSRPTAPTSCTAATRCARCWPSSSAGRARAASSSLPSRATSWPSSSTTSSAPPPTTDSSTRLYARSEGNPLFTEELLAAGLDGRGELPPTLRDALMVRIEALPQDAQEVLRVISAGRSGWTTRCWPRPRGLESGALREALREAVGRPRHRRRRGGQLRLPPRAAARGRPRRPAARRARRAAPRARPGARAPHAGAGRQRAAGGRHRPPLPRRRRPARGASPPPCARPTRPRGPRPRRGGGPVRARAASCGRACPTPRRWRASTTSTLLAKAADAHNDKPRAEALYEAALSEIDETAEPHRAADLLERLANVRWGLGAAERSLATLERGLALLARRRGLQRRARDAPRPAGEVPHAPRPPPQRRRGGPGGAGRGRGGRRACGAQPRAQRHGRPRSWPSARSTRARASCARRSSWRSPTGACRRCARPTSTSPTSCTSAGARRRAGPSPTRAPSAPPSTGGSSAWVEHGRGGDRARPRRLGLRRAPPARPAAA